MLSEVLLHYGRIDNLINTHMHTYTQSQIDKLMGVLWIERVWTPDYIDVCRYWFLFTQRQCHSGGTHFQHYPFSLYLPTYLTPLPPLRTFTTMRLTNLRFSHQTIRMTVILYNSSPLIIAELLRPLPISSYSSAKLLHHIAVVLYDTNPIHATSVGLELTSTI